MNKCNQVSCCWTRLNKCRDKSEFNYGAAFKELKILKRLLCIRQLWDKWECSENRVIFYLKKTPNLLSLRFKQIKYNPHSYRIHWISSNQQSLDQSLKIDKKIFDFVQFSVSHQRNMWQDKCVQTCHYMIYLSCLLHLLLICCHGYLLLRALQLICTRLTWHVHVTCALGMCK